MCLLARSQAARPTSNPCPSIICSSFICVHRLPTPQLVTSKLHLVDLAGSERVAKTGSSGGTLEEAKYINKSLTFLEQVVIALISKSRDHVPYRSSKLTYVSRPLKRRSDCRSLPVQEAPGGMSRRFLCVSPGTC
jgi:hypothetical protein